jgi:hypothetical protein
MIASLLYIALTNTSCLLESPQELFENAKLESIQFSPQSVRALMPLFCRVVTIIQMNISL